MQHLGTSKQEKILASRAAKGKEMEIKVNQAYEMKMGAPNPDEQDIPSVPYGKLI